MSESHTRARAGGLRLQAAAEEMIAEVQQLPPDLITWKPANDVWSVMEILCHVQEFVPYWAGQITQIVEHPDQTWGRDHTNTDRLAAVESAAGRTLSDVQHAIRTAARDAAERIAHLNDADLDVEATSKNPRWGVKPAHFVLDHLLVQHVEKHIGQIRRNVSQYPSGR